DDVLDLSRIEQGVLSLRDDALDLAQVLHASVDAVQPLAAARSVHITLAVPPGALIRGDAAALEQVLVNLLSNAIKYNHVGGRVAVGLGTPDAGPSTMLIDIRDDGEGLQPAQL